MNNKNNEDNKKIYLSNDFLDLSKDDINLDFIRDVFSNIYSWLIDKWLYEESGSVLENYDNIKYALESLYRYIYTPRESNLSLRDAKILASFLMNNFKKINELLDNFEK